MFKKQNASLALAALSAFCVYTCMFAYRKPFTAAIFSDIFFLGIDYKIWLVIAQTIGYTLSKFYGIRFIGELQPQGRPVYIIGFIGGAWLSLVLFALVPAPINSLLLVVNGFFLGAIYGLVFSYLEGRRYTELLGAVLATSFIFASGFTQSVGKFVLDGWQVSRWWMPAVTGALFLLPLLLFTYLLNRTPPPTAADIAERRRRLPMTGNERRLFIRSFLPGLIFLVATYVLLTIIREYRSNFAANLWAELGQGNNAAVFTQSELPASLVTLFLLSLLVFVRSNRKALMINHLVVLAGFLLSIISTWMYQNGTLSPFWWISFVGMGMYAGYVPFNVMLFERLVACFGSVRNAGFLIYLADSFGYLASDAVLLVKSFADIQLTWSRFFENIVLFLSLAGVVLISLSAFYFKRKLAVVKSEK
jgi:MFS family permease